MNELTAEKAFNFYMHQLDWRNSIGGRMELLTDMLGFSNGRKSNFLGGSGDFRRTTHEKIFTMLYPRFKQQVVFGTGKGGLEEWFSKKFTVDFYDENRKIIYEIDGSNHKTPRRINKDKLRECFFLMELGIRTVRFSNKEVEDMLLKRLIEIESEGRLNELIEDRNQSA